MDAMDDAINAIGVAVDELEEEELELDEEFDDDDEPGVSDGLHTGIVIGKGWQAAAVCAAVSEWTTGSDI